MPDSRDVLALRNMENEALAILHHLMVLTHPGTNSDPDPQKAAVLDELRLAALRVRRCTRRARWLLYLPLCEKWASEYTERAVEASRTLRDCLVKIRILYVAQTA